MKQKVFHQGKEVMIQKRIKNPVVLWLRICSYSWICINVLLNVLYGGFWEGYFIGGVYFLGGFIAIWCGNKCANYAVKIKKSPNWAYYEGFIFSLLGLLVYYIYYRIKSKKK